MDGVKTCCEIGSEINRLLDDRTKQLSASCVGDIKRRYHVTTNLSEGFTDVRRFWVFTPHRRPNVKWFFLLLASLFISLLKCHLKALRIGSFVFQRGSERRSVQLKEDLAHFSKHLNVLLLTSDNLSVFGWTDGKRGFYWLATCSVPFQRKMEVCMCMF